MLTAQYVMTAHIVGLRISAVRRDRLLTHFRVTRNARGLWGLHPIDPGSLFVTTLVYVAARLLGASRDSPWLLDAQRFFEREGGVQTIPTWGKVWLALLGMYEWDGVNPILPELWLLPSRVPVHPSNYYCHTRSIYMGLAVLHAERAVAPRTPITETIRDELYPGGYERVDFSAFASQVREGDAPFRPGFALRAAYALSRGYQGLQLRSLRQRALDMLRLRMRSDLRASNHLSLSPVNGLLCIVALWFADPRDPDIGPAAAALEAWLWEDEKEGARVAGARSVCWDTAFALQALAAARGASTQGASVVKGASFLASQQIETSDVDHRSADRIDPRGGWCFSEVAHNWPVSDCTAEALVALLQASVDTVGREQAASAVRFMLRCQNGDGGFGSYEPRKTGFSLAWLNPSEMFGSCMTERSYVECTGSCLMALREVQRRFPHLLRSQIERAIARGRRFLIRAQRPDGSWEGAWGVHYVYGTMFGVRGLVAAGVEPGEQPIRAACRWLLGRQHSDGSWAEHPDGIAGRRYVDGRPGAPIQTAWALMTLVEAHEPDTSAIARAASFLARSQQSNGEWPDDLFAGVFFETALLNYRLYRQYFPVMALGLARRHTCQHQA
jgi:lanosterol synthase